METNKKTPKDAKKSELLDKYDDVLTRMAIEEINKEIAKKSKIVNEIGPSGWTKPIPGRTNKRFLRNTLNNVVSHNKRKSNQQDNKRKSNQLDQTRKNVENLIRRDKEKSKSKSSR